MSSDNYVSDTSTVSSTYSDTNCTPFPSLTKSQRVRLDEIIHREPIGYASSFDLIEIEPVDEHVDEQTQTKNNGCCLLI